MGSLPKPGELVSAIGTAVSKAVGKDISNIEGFSKDQALQIEKLTIRLGEMIAAGEFKDDAEGEQFYRDILADLISNLTKTLKGLSVIAVEHAWNAVVDVVWKALDKATGLALPRPIPV